MKAKKKDAPVNPSPEAVEDILDRLDAKDRLQRRHQAPNLSITLTPLWVWMLGLAYLPEDFPAIARGLFHASCWMGFLWFAYQTWQARAEEKALLADRNRRDRREAFRKAAARKVSPAVSEAGRPDAGKPGAISVAVKDEVKNVR